jgi:hypothetical protein
MSHLADDALKRGIQVFRGHVLLENHVVRQALHELGASGKRDGEVLHVDVPVVDILSSRRAS